MTITADSILENLRASFAGTDVADAVAAATVTVSPKGYSVLVDQRAVAHRVAALILSSFGADPESGDATVRIEYGVFVHVTYTRPAPIAATDGSVTLPEGDAVTDTVSDGNRAGYEEALTEQGYSDGEQRLLKALAVYANADGVNYGDVLGIGAFAEVMPDVLADLMHLADKAKAADVLEDEPADDDTGSDIIYNAVDHAQSHYFAEVEDRAAKAAEPRFTTVQGIASSTVHVGHVGRFRDVVSECNGRSITGTWTAAQPLTVVTCKRCLVKFGQ